MSARSSRPAVALLALLLLTAAAVPNDPLVSQQPHLNVVRAFEAWDVRRGEGAVVAVLDTGVDLTHPDLEGRLVEGIDLIDPGTPPDDPQGHGTIVAGIIAAVADNGRGGAGVAPQAQVMPIRVLDERGRGTSDVVAAGIRHAIAQEVQVINLSLAEVRSDGVLGLPLVANSDVHDAITEAAAAGVIVVAAAGNDGQASTPYATDLPVIVVGASTPEDLRWDESNHDERTLFAPGTDILSTWHQGRFAKADGTSFATPIVAAGAAMLAGADLAHDEVTRRLIDTAVDIGVGLGRVDLAAAVEGVPPAPALTAPAIPPPPVEEQPPPPAIEEAPAVEGLEEVRPVQEVLGPPPSQVTEAPPPIATIDPDSVGEELRVDGGPAVPVRPDPTPTPAPPPPADPPAILVEEGSRVDARGILLSAAGVLLGADLLFAGWVLARRRNADGPATSVPG